MFFKAAKLRIESERMYLRLPEIRDHKNWIDLREGGQDFLRIWEPDWASNHFSIAAFKNRIYWARKAFNADEALPLFLFKKDDDVLMGAITLDNIRRGPAQSASLGYWIGQEFSGNGYMSEAVKTIVNYSFSKKKLSRIEAATLPENAPSRRVLEKSGFKYEGVAQSYLQINGRWRTHVLYANLHNDRRGKTNIG